MGTDTGDKAGLEGSISDYLSEGYPAGNRLGDEDFEEPEPDDKKGSDDSEEGGDKKGKKPPEEPGEGDDEEPELKYKTHEEAEKAYAESEKAMHAANERASKAEKERDELVASKKEPEEKKDPFEAIAEKYAADAAKLDPNDPELQVKMMKLLGKQMKEVAGLQDTQAREVHASRRDTAKKQLAGIQTSLKEAGLESWEDEFYMVMRSVPPTIKDFDAAVKWGVGKVQGLVDKLEDANKKAEEEREAKEKESYALGSMGKRKQPSKKKGSGDEENESPESVTECMEVLRKERVIK